MDLPFLKNDITKILRPKNRSFIARRSKKSKFCIFAVFAYNNIKHLEVFKFHFLGFSTVSADTFNVLNAQATRFGYKKGRAK